MFTPLLISKWLVIDGIFAASERACMNFCRDHSPSSAKMHESDNQVLSEVWMVYGASSVTRPNIPVLARSTWLDEFRSMHGGFGAQ